MKPPEYYSAYVKQRYDRELRTIARKQRALERQAGRDAERDAERKLVRLTWQYGAVNEVAMRLLKELARQPVLDRRLKRILSAINGRCNDLKNKYYGGKGIKNFLTLDDLRYLWERDGAASMMRPSIDRKKSSYHYSRETCRFTELSINSMKFDRLYVDGQVIDI